MKEIDPIMKQTYLKDFGDYLQIIKLIETNQMEIEIGIEQLENLLQDLIDDLFIMSVETHDFFINQKAELGKKNKEKKESLKAMFRDAEDEIDLRNQKRLLLKYDFDKHRKILAALKGISNERGWFR